MKDGEILHRILCKTALKSEKKREQKKKNIIFREIRFYLNKLGKVTGSTGF